MVLKTDLWVMIRNIILQGKAVNRFNHHRPCPAAVGIFEGCSL